MTSEKVYSVRLTVNVVVRANTPKEAMAKGVKLAMPIDGLESARPIEAFCPAEDRNYPYQVGKS